MKIFEIEFPQGELEWVLAKDKGNAIRHSGSDIDEDCKVSELPHSKWSTHFIFDPNDYKSDSENDDDRFCGYKILQTFEEYANENKSGGVIVTSEY